MDVFGSLSRRKLKENSNNCVFVALLLVRSARLWSETVTVWLVDTSFVTLTIKTSSFCLIIEMVIIVWCSKKLIVWASKIEKLYPQKLAPDFLIYKCNKDTSMNTENQITKNDNDNPFKDMGFIKFWIVSTVFWFSFPVSLVLCYLALGSVKTKQLVKALVHDFLQTLFIILVIICVIVYGIYHYVSGLF